MKKLEPLGTVGGNVKSCNEKQYGSSSKINYRITLWFNNSISEYTQKNWKQGLEEIFIH